MKKHLSLLAVFWFYAYCAFAQTVERNAQINDIVGDWRLIDTPMELQPKALKQNPWPAKCQWFAYLKTGELKSFDRSGPDATCDGMTFQEMDKVVAQIPAVVSWKYSFSPEYQKGIIIVSRSDVQKYHEVWEPHVVTQKFSRAGADFLPGDLILYLADLNKKQIVWIRHLRRVE